ncbi:MAG TPA: Ni/Fe hydrogenase subunit alpha [Candidatus Acidoferrales bacterium]|nr:Ni/Fe hydrogenase subunit alpha [Candidatus Acidoferrales bacterium]
MKNSNVEVNVHHLTRVEGHGNISVKIKDGIVEKCEWSIPEAPRFFEAMVVGRSWYELHHVTSRICGICSIGHTLASLKATESALGVTISDQDLKLRKLALHAENLQSHILHLGFLVLPDLMGVGSVIPLASTNLAEVKIVLKLHRTANEMSNLICGRTTHPQRLIPGGFSKIPSMKELAALRDKLQDSIPNLQAVAELFKSLSHKLPNFKRETEFIALTDSNEYALYDGKLGSSDTASAPVRDYLAYTNEYIVPQSTAKWAKHVRDSYMVGALARFNLNHDRLSPMAKKTAATFNLSPVCYNPFMNSIAQLVEVVHSVEDSIRLVNELEATGLNTQPDYNKPEIKVKAGTGVGAVEVPRGILFHDYTYNDKGVCTKANCIIPTNQNHANIQLDMNALVPQIAEKPQKEIELALEMLVRAYDPCISCSTHVTKIN